MNRLTKSEKTFLALALLLAGKRAPQSHHAVLVGIAEKIGILKELSEQVEVACHAEKK